MFMLFESNIIQNYQYSIIPQNLQELEDNIETIPQLSLTTLSCLDIKLKNLNKSFTSEIFSKEQFQKKIVEIKDLKNRQENLKENEQFDTCSAIGRGIGNLACCVTTIAIYTGIPWYTYTTVAAQLATEVAALASTMSCSYIGMQNAVRANQPNVFKFPHKESPFYMGLICGPCFAGYEAIYQIPRRIKLAELEITIKEQTLINEFDQLIHFCNENEELNLGNEYTASS